MATTSSQYLLLILLLFGISSLCSSMGSGSSGSGSGDQDDVDVCEGVTCHGGTCEDQGGVAMCSCPIGMATYDNKYKCEVCAVGYWGEDCAKSCADGCGGEGHFSSCNATTGACVCNVCWMGSSCTVATPMSDGYACVLTYLESVDKDLDDYGGHVPVTDDTNLRELAGNLVDDEQATIVQDDSSTLTVVEREDIGARPLLRFSFILKDGPGNTDYDNAVSNIKDKVKTGEIRGTLIIDESDGDSGTVTLNA